MLHDRHTLKINNAEILPFGPTVALAALQVPSAITSTDYFTLSHSFRNLKLGYDILITTTPSPHPEIREITINLRITSVDGVRNDAIEELQIVVHENTITQQLEIASTTKKPLEGPVVELIGADDDTCQGRFEYIIAMLRHKMDKIRGTGTIDCYEDEDHHMRDYKGHHGHHDEGHMDSNHMEKIQHMKDNQHLKGDHMEGNHMSNGQHMKGDHRGGEHMEGAQHMKDDQHMGKPQGHRSYHKGDHMWDHMEDNQHMKGNHMGQGHCRYQGGAHRSQWLKHSRPSYHRGHFFTKLFGHVLMPIFVGILAGAFVALAGLIVGKGMRKLYSVIATREGGSVMHEEHEDGVEEEKGLLKEMEAREELAEVVVEGPPAYVEAGTGTVKE